MASHLMVMNIIFQENTCLTNLNHYKRSKITIFEDALTQERIRTVFSGVQPVWYWKWYGISWALVVSKLTCKVYWGSMDYKVREA